MTRRQFLTAIGVALLALIGVTRFMHQLNGNQSSSSLLGSSTEKYGGK